MLNDSLWERIWYGIEDGLALAWNNKTQIVMAIVAVTGTMDMLGEPVPHWLYILEAALGGSALHLATKRN